MRRALAAAAAATLAACFNPTYNDKTCGVNDECPAGLTCVSGVCRAAADAAEIDAPTDAADVDAIDASLADAVDATPIDAVDAAPIDAIDARPFDAAIDANTDAQIVVYTGRIALLEANILLPSGSSFGQGAIATIAFTGSDQLPPPMLEEIAGQPFGCKVWSFTPSQAATARAGLDEGPVQFGSSTSSAPVFPPCTFATGAGYQCPDPATSSTGGTISTGPFGVGVLTDSDVTYNSSNSTGRYVRISNATNSANNGLFPIVSVTGANSIAYASPTVVAETLPASASHINIAAAGATPSLADPGLLADDVVLNVGHTAGGGGHIPTFAASTTGGTTIGDDFTLGGADQMQLMNIPLNGSGFSINCDGTACPSASATGTLFEITTTDGLTSGLSPFAMPNPVVRQVVLRCLNLGVGLVTIPPSYSAFLATSGARRVQAIFARVTVLTGSAANVTSVAGHAVVAYTTPACSDGQDNDADGLIDFPMDTGCTSPSDNSE